MSAGTVELCLASPSSFPDRGGAQLRFSRYLPGLARRGIRTEVLAGTPKARKLSTRDIESDWYRLPPGSMIPEEALEGAPVHRVRLPDSTGWRRTIVFNQTLLQLCRSRRRRLDVVQILPPMPPRTIPWLLRLRSLGIPTLYACTIVPDESSQGLRATVHRRALRALYDRLDCIVANNDVLREYLLDLGVKTRIEVIPNGVNLAIFSPSPDGDAGRRGLRSSLGLQERDRLVVCVGSVSPRKGTDLLLRAWGLVVARIPRCHLALLGTRKDLSEPSLAGFRQKLEDLSRASGARDRIHFTGPVDNVEEYLRASDLFVLPSWREGLPNALIEAMATGVPAVITPFAGLSCDVGRPKEHFLLVDRDPVALASAMVRVLTQPKLGETLGCNARRWIVQNMDVESSLDRFAELYRELSQGPSNRRPDAA